MGFDLGMLFWAAGILTVLILMMRWVFAPPSRPRTGRPQSGPGADLGLLVPVLAATSRARALTAKNQLSEQGVRCSLSRLAADSYDVLVFRQDLARATELLGEQPD